MSIHKPLHLQVACHLPPCKMNVAFVTPTLFGCGVFIASGTTTPQHFSCRSNSRQYALHISRQRSLTFVPIAAAATSSSPSPSSPPNASTPWVSSSSTALNYDNKASISVTRYIDLRTMQVILPEDAHLDPSPPSHFTFSPIPVPSSASKSSSSGSPSTTSTSSTYSTHSQKISQIFFSADTVPLTDSQREAVQALLSHRSVIYSCPSPDDKFLLFLDIVMRSRVWKKVVVYCASSRRVAETMFTTLCTQLTPERHHEVFLDFGDGSYSNSNQNRRPSSSFDESTTRVIITSPRVLRKSIMSLDDDSPTWIKSTSILFIDNLTDAYLPLWEEILLAVPSSVQLCLLSSHLTRPHLELLPIWVETIQSITSVITPSSSTPLHSSSSSSSSSSMTSGYLSTILNRIERPHGMPLLRTFAYNAAIHTAPVQVSLTILKELLLKEMDSANMEFIPEYAQAFLHGVTSILAENPKELLFRTANEAAYADIASLVVADAKKTEESMRTKFRRRVSANTTGDGGTGKQGNKQARRKERTASSKAAARRRRDTAFSNSKLLPAIVLIKGDEQSIHCAQAIESAFGDNIEKRGEAGIKNASNCVNLLWDDDTKYHVDSIVQAYKGTRVNLNGNEDDTVINEEITELDMTILELLRNGIGVINDLMTPPIRIIVEELYRSGLIPLLIADTRLGSNELLSLACAKSVIVEAGTLAACDDELKGLVSSSTVSSLSGRRLKDDVGNLILVWYDESIDDETAGCEIASNLLSPELSSTISTTTTTSEMDFFGTGVDLNSAAAKQVRFSHEQYDVRRGMHSNISRTYDTVLRSLKRFGIDGNEIIYEYTLSSFKGWLKRAGIHATLEKMNVEKTAIDDRLAKENWNEIISFERKTGKLNEAKRLLYAMTQRFEKVLERKMLSELKQSPAGRIIGIKLKPRIAPGGTLTQGTPSEDNTDSDDTKGKSDINQVDGMQEKGDPHRLGKLTYAVFVTIFDQDFKGKHIIGLDDRYLAVCITSDGLWTMVPLHGVNSVSEIIDENEEDDDSAKSNVISNVDLLDMPHPATFDVELGYQIAKSSPVDESEQLSLHRVCDELINRIAGETPPKLMDMTVAEFEEQRVEAKLIEDSLKKSEWYGRDEERQELRKLRRRTAVLGDEMKILQKRKQLFEDEIKETNEDYRSIQKSLMAVLEDCHALLFTGGRTSDAEGRLGGGSGDGGNGIGIKITPIGSIACLIPGEFPLFSSACLCLADELGDLNVGEMAAFVGVVIGDTKEWKGPKLSKHGLVFNEDDENVNKAEEKIDSVNNNNKRDNNNNFIEEDNDDEIDEELFESLSNLSRSKSSTDDDEEAALRKLWGKERKEADAELSKVHGLFPGNLSELVVEILQALRQLHRRHLSECQGTKRIWIDDIVPATLNDRLGKAAMQFAQGAPWKQVVEILGNEAGYAVRELRKVKFVLELIWTDNGKDGEFDQKTTDLAMRTLQAMNRWPLSDDQGFKVLTEGGVIEKQWAGNTYDKWWRSAREDVRKMKTEIENENENEGISADE